MVEGRDGVRAWESVGRVASVGADSLFTRTLTPGNALTVYPDDLDLWLGSLWTLE